MRLLAAAAAAAAAAFGNPVEMQIIGPHPGPSESDPWGAGLPSVLSSHPGDADVLKF